ncbi:copper resistance protein B [Dyella monticola]|uniref:Copper resistance protein B n=2 Tax=Dyella monticola TaxID=1927958 RepID=A0A370X6I6_9GAMM|nr:copper resistance protein B [Dyella monticola]
MPAPATSTHGAPQAVPITSSMPNMDMHHDSMGALHGSKPSGDMRNPDYSDGLTTSPMTGMGMQDNAAQHLLLVDQLEYFLGRDANGAAWDAEGWYGTDTDKAWFRTEGELNAGRLENADMEALWAHAITAHWDTQLGVRHDVGVGSDRTWAAFGIQGLAPYWFQVEATGYVSNAGRTAARLRIEYELRFTQRLILQPEFETNLYSKHGAQGRIVDDMSDMQLGLRLRYEFNRQFAPYVGLVWVRRFGATASNLPGDREPVFDQQIVAGLRFWF